MVDMQKFLVYRKQPGQDPTYERYEVPLRSGMSILDALFYIQDHYESNFSFRYSCRGAICGSCGMTVDKFPQLACKTQVSGVKAQKVPKLPELKFGDVPDNWDEKTEILIEPLPNMKTVRDLVVDMEPFWKFYGEVQPFFVREYNDEQPESLQKPEDARSIEHLVYCILCGLCWSCPVNETNPHYLGPAALAKANRFIMDTRLGDEHRDTIAKRASKEDSVPACEKHYVCNRVCPKGVKPGTAIRNIRENYLSS